MATAPATSAPQAHSALAIPAFRLLWTSTFLFMLVFNAQRFTFGWLVLDGLGRSEGWQGFVGFCLGIPFAVLVLHAGVWADRWDRRRLLLASQAGSLAVVTLTAVLVALDLATLAVIIGLALAAGATQAVGQPVRAALVPALVGRERLFNAIALNALAMTASLILGPVVAQVSGKVAGFEGAFAFQALLLAAGTVLLLRLRVPAHSDGPPTGTSGAQIRAAVTHIRHTSSLARLFVLLVVSSLTVNAAVMTTLQAFVKEDLGREAGDAGPVLALMGVGMAVTSFVVMRKGDMARKGAAFQRAMMCGSTSVILMGLATEYWMLLVLGFAMGLSGGFYINMNQGLIQANTPQHLMGRVMAVYTLVLAGFMPIGALVLGLSGEVFGLGPTISVAGALSLSVVVVTYVTGPAFRDLR